MSNLYAENLSSVTSLIASGDLVVNSAEVAGGLKIPVKTEAERDALTGVQPGMIVYNSTSNQVQSYANSEPAQTWDIVGALHKKCVEGPQPI